MPSHLPYQVIKARNKPHDTRPHGTVYSWQPADTIWQLAPQLSQPLGSSMCTWQLLLMRRLDKHRRKRNIEVSMLYRFSYITCHFCTRMTFAAAQMQTWHDCMYFYGYVLITQGKIPEVSAHIPHKCTVFQMVKSPQRGELLKTDHGFTLTIRLRFIYVFSNDNVYILKRVWRIWG